MLGLDKNRYDKNRLPLAFFLQAYVSTFAYFFDQIHLNDTTISALFKDEASYRSFWTQYNGPLIRELSDKRKDDPNASGSLSQPDNNETVTREIQKLRTMQDRLHAKIDKTTFRHEPSPSTTERRRIQSERDRAANSTRIHDKGSKGKGKGENKRQRDNWDYDRRDNRSGRDRRR